jgi:voltage-gated potassium channel
MPTTATTSAEPHERPGPYQLFMLVLCILALLSLGVSLTMPLEPSSRAVLEYADIVVCALFFGDFLHSLYYAPNRMAYFFKWGWIDLLSSIPAVGPLRLGRFVRVVRVLRVIRAIRSARAIAVLLLAKREQSAVLAALLLGLLLVACASIAILQFETVPGANIRTAGDALWWSMTTMSTVGYGDRYPVTTGGRIVAVFLMAGGVGIFGTLSGLVASWFLTPSQQAQDTDMDDIRATLAEIQRRLPERQGDRVS